MMHEKYVPYIKWYDYLWLIIPIAGAVMFVVSVEERYHNTQKVLKE